MNKSEWEKICREEMIKATDLTSYVYFVRWRDRIKIGHSINVYKRYRELQTSSPVDLKYIGSMPGGPLVEKIIHFHFVRLCYKTEWFRSSPELKQFIEENI